MTFRNRQRSQPAIKHLVPQEPWTKLAADLFRLYGYYYLLVVEYDSKFAAIENFNNSQFLTAINKCKKVFSQYGIPKELITDNGPVTILRNLQRAGILLLLLLLLLFIIIVSFIHKKN